MTDPADRPANSDDPRRRLLALAHLGPGLALTIASPRWVQGRPGTDPLRGLPPAAVRAVGVAQTAGALGVLAGGRRVRAAAAGGLCALQVGAGWLHLRRGPRYGLPVNVALAGVAASVAGAAVREAHR